MLPDIFRELAGICAGLLIIFACSIYIYSIYRHETKPDRITWWVLFFGSCVLAISYFALGARDSAWIAFAYCGVYLAVALLSLTHGEGKGLTTFHIFCLGGAVISIFLWVLTNSPLIALGSQMVAEVFGLLPTAKKILINSSTESLFAWGIATFASLINLFAIGNGSFAVASYPVFLFATNAILTVLIVWGRNKFA